MPDRIYLDHAATAPLLPAARDAMTEELARWANPSSPHEEGRAARRRLEDARARIGRALSWTHDIVLTGGSSEAIAIALTRAKADRTLVGATEHDAVLRIARDATRLPVDASGLLRLDTLREALAGRGRALVAVQQVNSETGVIQPVAEIAQICADAGAIFFCDASQGAGKLDLPSADLIAFAAHKLGGPPGVGALLLRDLSLVQPSGGQERGYRGGTENLPAIAGLAAALEEGRDWIERAAGLRARLEDQARRLEIGIVGEAAPRLPTIGAYRMAGLAASAQLIRCDMAGIAISAGSACSSGTLKTSHVLAAMGLDDKAAGEVVRISVGRETDAAAIDRLLDLWAEMRR